MCRYVFYLFIFMTLSTGAMCEDWGNYIRGALNQRPSKYKRQTTSGKRLLREKERRIAEIDAQLPILMQEGEYERAQELLKESLRLTVERYDENDIHVAERFMSLGILYMEWDRPYEAEQAFTWCLNIGEPLLGKGSYQLSNAYKFLAVAYYNQGKYAAAEKEAETLVSIYVTQFGPDDPRTREAKDLLKSVIQER